MATSARRPGRRDRSLALSQSCRPLSSDAAAAAGGYGRAARAMHWLVAALAVMVVAFGWATEAAARNTPARGSLLLLHGSIGLTILAVMIVRILWRWLHPAPALPPSLTRLEAALAHLTHFGLYLLFIGMPLAGYVNAAAQGHAVSLFGMVSIPPLLPIDQRLAQAAITLIWSGNTSSICWSPPMLPRRYSTASSGETGCSSGCCPGEARLSVAVEPRRHSRRKRDAPKRLGKYSIVREHWTTCVSRFRGVRPAHIARQPRTSQTIQHLPDGHELVRRNDGPRLYAREERDPDGLPRALLAHPPKRVLSGAGGDETEAGAEKLQRLGEAAGAAQPLPPALHDEFGRAGRRRRGL